MVKKKSKDLQQKQKSRAKYPFPDELKELIRLVNLIPPDFHLQNLTMNWICKGSLCERKPAIQTPRRQYLMQ